MNSESMMEEMLSRMFGAVQDHCGDEIEDQEIDLASELDLASGGIPVRVNTFQEEMVLTNNRGLVVELANGSEFQITIVQSR